MSDLENRTRYEPGRGRAARLRALGRPGIFHPEPAGTAAGELLDRDPAAERHRRAAHGPRAQRLDPGRADPLRAACRAGARSGSSAPTTPASPPRPRSSGARRRGHEPARSSAARSSSSACGSGAQQYGGTIIDQFKRLGASCDYDDERFTLDDALRRAVLKVFVDALREGPDLPRQLHGQLGPGLALGDLGPRGRGARGRRHALLRSTTRSSGSAARSRSPPCGRRRCWPTPRSRSTPTTTATRGWSARPRSCRSSGGGCRSSPTTYVEARVRHRRAEDHARPRPQRLRDRPPRTGSRRSP